MLLLNGLCHTRRGEGFIGSFLKLPRHAKERHRELFDKAIMTEGLLRHLLHLKKTPALSILFPYVGIFERSTRLTCTRQLNNTIASGKPKTGSFLTLLFVSESTQDDGSLSAKLTA